MRAAKSSEGKGYISNRKALDVSDRTEDEIARIIQECTSVAPNKGRNERDHWIRIGMAIHSVLPDERGLKLWEDWSRKDPSSTTSGNTAILVNNRGNLSSLALLVLAVSFGKQIESIPNAPGSVKTV